jgi:hypothetical protein
VRAVATGLDACAEGGRDQRDLVRKGHTYRIVVSDLERRRPIWFGEKDRSEESMDAFYEWLGPTKNKKIRLAVWCARFRGRIAIRPYEECAGEIFAVRYYCRRRALATLRDWMPCTMS